MEKREKRGKEKMERKEKMQAGEMETDKGDTEVVKWNSRWRKGNR